MLCKVKLHLICLYFLFYFIQKYWPYNSRNSFLWLNTTIWSFKLQFEKLTLYPVVKYLSSLCGISLVSRNSVLTWEVNSIFGHFCLFKSFLMTLNLVFQTPLILFLIFKIFNWRIIALQCCVGFCHTTRWISCEYTYFPLPLKPPSHPTPPL